MLLRTLLAAASGLALALVFEPVAAPVLLPFALAGFLVSVDGLRSRRAWLPGLTFGVCFYFVHIWWMNTSTGWDAWVSLAGIEAAFYGLLGALAPPLLRLRGGPVWLAAAWVAAETVRSDWPFSGMPWGRLAFGVVDTPAAPALAYVGMTGLSFLLALGGFLLGRVLQSVLVAERRADARRAGLALGALVAVTLLPALVPYSLPAGQRADVAVVQGDVPGPGNDILFDHPQVTRNHVEATEELADAVAAGRAPQPDLVVWPENSTAVDPFATTSTRQEIERAVAAVGAPVLVGAIVDGGPDHVLNQGIVWSPGTGAGDRFTKQNPVPYGEYIPLRSWMPASFTEAGRLALVARDMLAGTRQEPLRVGDIRVADAICFDVAYDAVLHDQVVAGADLVTVQTSNASFVFTDQIDQQFAMTRLRAIETGKPLAVASVNGLSGIIAPDGSVLATADRQTRAVLVEEVTLRSGITPGMWVGHLAAPASLLVTGLGLLLALVTYRRSRRRAATSARPAGSGDPTSGDGERAPRPTPEGARP